MWNLDFITKEDFISHVSNTIEKYDSRLKSYDLKFFNRNIIDPIKILFDKKIYSASWKEIIANEIFRQRDKSSNNDIGYFHQYIFKYIKGCEVPNNGDQGGWDIIVSIPEGILLSDGSNVHKIYVEMKNKHNTMNSSSSSKTYMKMQNQLLEDDDCVCFLVEAIAKKSQNIKWETTVDRKKLSHNRIRRVSMDKFYSIVTGDSNAFYKVCMQLPKIITEIISLNGENLIPHDTVYQEILKQSKQIDAPEDVAIAVAFYLLGFGQYPSFNNLNKL